MQLLHSAEPILWHKRLRSLFSSAAVRWRICKALSFARVKGTEALTTLHRQMICRRFLEQHQRHIGNTVWSFCTLKRAFQSSNAAAHSAQLADCFDTAQLL